MRSQSKNAMPMAAVVAIRLESRGSALYRQRRVGKDGRPFDVLKLRTMVTGAEHMGAGLAIVCNVLGHPFTAVMSAGNSPVESFSLKYLTQ